MKSILWLAFLSIPVFASPTIYSVKPPIVASSPKNALERENGAINGVLAEADLLSEKYGSRPPYSGPKFSPGERLSTEQAILVAPYVLAGESENKDVGCIVDSNGKLSCGRAQFQDWYTFWEPASGISGDPNNPSDAVRMLLWGLENGYIQRWGAAIDLNIVTTPR